VKVHYWSWINLYPCQLKARCYASSNPISIAPADPLVQYRYSTGTRWLRPGEATERHRQLAFVSPICSHRDMNHAVHLNPSGSQLCAVVTEATICLHG
jgi:hypothetical protein